MHTHYSIAESTILTVAQMRQADAHTIASGIAGFSLMQRAGAGVGEVIASHYDTQPVLVLAGSGNNGGDGFIAAEYLRERGWPVRVACSVSPSQLQGDAYTAAKSYKGTVLPLTHITLDDNPLVVDALFGTGLSRPLEEPVITLLKSVSDKQLTVVAVDIPSGLNGDNAQVMGYAAKAQHTVTFHRKKPAHLLLSGRMLCGKVTVVDIGISEPSTHIHTLFQNSPALWIAALPRPTLSSHKYNRGHAIVVGGEIYCTGAAKLAARAALRVGAGLVSVATSEEALPIYAAGLTAVMTKPVDSIDELRALATDRRVTSLLIGPGMGVSNYTRHKVLELLATGKPIALDADALRVFGEKPQECFSALHMRAVLTPHEGEFEALFGGDVVMKKDKLTRAKEAAKIAGAVVVLKGTDTVIASPDGYAIINGNAPPQLATAGSGDVLAGMISGLLAQGMPPFLAAAAAVWIHGAAAAEFGAGLIAEDLTELLPDVLNYLYQLQPE